jgi:hypothetical protein
LPPSVLAPPHLPGQHLKEQTMTVKRGEIYWVEFDPVNLAL